MEVTGRRLLSLSLKLLDEQVELEIPGMAPKGFLLRYGALYGRVGDSASRLRCKLIIAGAVVIRLGSVGALALALSLHSTGAARRADLLPKVLRYEHAALFRDAADYAESTGYPLQVQWTLLDGVNDGDDEIPALIALFAGRYAMLNFIPWNAVEGMPFRRPSWDKARALAVRVNAAGVLTKLRDSVWQDVGGGCGQLRARHAAGRAAR